MRKVISLFVSIILVLSVVGGVEEAKSAEGEACRPYTAELINLDSLESLTALTNNGKCGNKELNDGTFCNKDAAKASCIKKCKDDLCPKDSGDLWKAKFKEIQCCEKTPSCKTENTVCANNNPTPDCASFVTVGCKQEATTECDKSCQQKCENREGGEQNKDGKIQLPGYGKNPENLRHDQECMKQCEKAITEKTAEGKLWQKDAVAKGAFEISECQDCINTHSPQFGSMSPECQNIMKCKGAFPELTGNIQNCPELKYNALDEKARQWAREDKAEARADRAEALQEATFARDTIFGLYDRVSAAMKGESGAGGGAQSSGGAGGATC